MHRDDGWRGIELEQGAFLQAALADLVEQGEMRHGLEAGGGIELVDLVGLVAAVDDDATQTHVVIFRFGTDRLHDAVHREDGVEVIGRDDQRAVGVLQGCGKSAANHIAQHIKDHHVGVFQQVVLFEQLDGLTNHIAAAAGARRRAAGFDAHHAVVAGENKVFQPQLFGMEIHGLQRVDHRGIELLGQGEGGIVLGVAADLQHAFTQLAEGRRQVRRGGALADATLAVDSKYFSVANLHARVHLYLHAAFTIATRFTATGDLGRGYQGRFNHAATPV